MTLKRCRLSLWQILWATQAGFEKFNPFLTVKEVEFLCAKVGCHPQETLGIRHQASSLRLGDKDTLVWRFRPVTSERLIGWLVGWHWVGCRHSDSVWTVDSSGWQLRGSLVSGVYGTGAEREIWSAAWDEIKQNVPLRPQTTSTQTGGEQSRRGGTTGPNWRPVAFLRGAETDGELCFWKIGPKILRIRTM